MATQKGFTLIEILVALIILAIGLLGVAGLQTLALQSTGGSNERSIAIYYANDMADRIRANEIGRDGGIYDSEANAAETASCFSAAGCTPQQLAAQDISDWLTNLGASLPAGDGDITRNGAIYTVTVSWTARIKGGVEDGANVSTETNQVVLNFMP